MFCVGLPLAVCNFGTKFTFFDNCVKAPLATKSGSPVRFIVQGQDHGLNIRVIVEPGG